MSSILNAVKEFFASLLAVIMGLFPWLNSDLTETRNDLMDGTQTIQCVAFDGNEKYGSATLVLENGFIMQDIVFSQTEADCEYFLMPALIDAHTHVNSEKQIDRMINNGVMTTCDAAAGTEMIESAGYLDIHTSLTTVMPGLADGRTRVEELIAQGADYIKVMVDMPKIMGGELIDSAVLKDMVDCAHENAVKVAAHVTTVEAAQLAVDTGVDILIHIPIGEEFPVSLAQQIVNQNVAVVPTLVMMKAFSESLIYGYTRSDYNDAVEAVRLLDSLGATILVGTDSNASFYVPKINHGSSLHDEMQLLVDAGMNPVDVLQGATSKVSQVFGLENSGTIENKSSVMMLVKGRPDKTISDSTEIVQIWVDGEPVFGNEGAKPFIDNVPISEDD